MEEAEGMGIRHKIKVMLHNSNRITMGMVEVGECRREGAGEVHRRSSKDRPWTMEWEEDMIREVASKVEALHLHGRDLQWTMEWEEVAVGECPHHKDPRWTMEWEGALIREVVAREGTQTVAL
jgi:hypothetical protein